MKEKLEGQSNGPNSPFSNAHTDCVDPQTVHIDRVMKDPDFCIKPLFGESWWDTFGEPFGPGLDDFLLEF